MKTLNNNVNQNAETGATAAASKCTIYAFTDGSCLNGGLGIAGPSGWAAIFTSVSGKVVHQIGGGCRKGTSSSMEEKAFIEAIKGTNFEKFNLDVVTDYLACLHALQAIAEGKCERGWASKEFVKEVRKVLKEKGLEVSKTSVKEGKTVCGSLKVTKIKAHEWDHLPPEELPFLALGNIGSDKSAKGWAKRFLI